MLLEELRNVLRVDIILTMERSNIVIGHVCSQGFWMFKL